MEHEIIEKKIKEFVDLILSNNIKLTYLESRINENLSGVLIGNKIERKVEFKLKSIGTGQQNDKDPIVTGEYEVEIEDKMEDISLIAFKANYRLILSLKSDGNYNGELTSQQQKIIGIFFNQSGRLILFPYVRHLYDIIAREADFFMPPIPPLLFKK